MGLSGGSQEIIIEFRSTGKALIFEGGPGTTIYKVNSVSIFWSSSICKVSTMFQRLLKCEVKAAWYGQFWTLYNFTATQILRKIKFW